MPYYSKHTGAQVDSAVDKINGLFDGSLTEVEKKAIGANIDLADNSQLTAELNRLSKTYAFGGVATPSTNPSSLEVNTFYLAAEAGVYANMGGVAVENGDIAAIVWDGSSWVYEHIASFAKVTRGKNVYEYAEHGYVSIQNIVVDVIDSYSTSAWITIQAGQRVIFSADKNTMFRVFIGRNTLPTTAGGSRIEYITSGTTASNGRFFYAYTATELSYARFSTSTNDRPMVEFTSNAEPSNYDDGKTMLQNDIGVSTIQSGGNIWYGKNVLVIGDSLTAAGVWQTKLADNLGMNVSTHALGGIGYVQMLAGSADGTLPPLQSTQVKDKDLIIIAGGYNHRAGEVGSVGDLYPAQSTTIGMLQYLINGVYDLLNFVGNLECRVVVVAPHCAGAYEYIPVNWDGEYPVGSGRTGETVANGIIACAEYNRIACLDLFHTSGINKFTWSIFAASAVAEENGVVKDQLHLNSEVGYPYLGDRISQWVKTI